MIGHFLRLWLVLLFIGLHGGAAGAADASSSPPPTLGTLEAGQARAAIAGLSDEQVRALLIDRLEAEAAQAASVAQTDTVGLVADDAQTIRYRLGETVAGLPDLPYAVLFVFDELTRHNDSTELLIGLATILALAALAEWLFHRALRSFRHELGTSSPRTELGRLGLLIIQALTETLALVVFTVTAILTYFALHPEQVLVRQAFWAFLITIFLTRAFAIIGRLLLAPHRPRLRLPDLSNEDATSLYRLILVLAAVVSSAATFGQLAPSANLPEPLVLALGTALQWLVLCTCLAGILLHRRQLERWLGGRRSTRRTSIGALLSRHWTILISVGLIGTGIVAMASRLLTVQSQAVPLTLSLVVMVAVPAIDGLLRMLVRHLLSSPEEPASEAGAGEGPTATERPGREPPVDSEYAPVIMHNLRIVLAVVVIVTLGALWNIDIDRLAAGSLGTRIADALFTILIAVLLASGLWGAIKTAIDRHAPDALLDEAAMADGEGGHGGLSRLQTLLPVVRKFLFATIVVMVGMTVISALGVDIGPLLAGAGVVGIAIGFGAQALVRDIFSGIFFLIDDAFRVGEYIDVGAAKGTVERISIRSLRLRHHLGQINTVPFGEIKTVTNFSRDWVIMKLELRVPLDTDIEKVRKLVKQVGQQMQQDEELGPNLLLPPKSQGVHRMEPTAYVVRVKFMAKPGEQFILRRELFRRLHETFREHGIRLGVSPIFVGATESAAAGTASAAAASLAQEPQEPGGGATGRA